MVKTSPSNAGGAGSIPGRGAKIPHALRPKNQNIKQKQHCNKFNKDFKNGLHQKKKNLKKKKEVRGHCRMFHISSSYCSAIPKFPSWLCTMMVWNGTNWPEGKLRAPITLLVPLKGALPGPAQAQKVTETQSQLPLVLFRNSPKCISFKFKEKAQACPHHSQSHQSLLAYLFANGRESSF